MLRRPRLPVRTLRAALLTGALWLAAVPALSAPRVVVTIAPIHSLVAGVMDGLGEPHLLLPAGASPHTYQMRPSDAAMLSEAQLVVWVGPALERFLERPIGALAKGSERLTLLEAPGLALLPARRGGAFEKDEHEHPDSAQGAGVDAHIWLAVPNALAVVAAVADRLAALDPAQAGAYRRNAAGLESRLAALDEELRGRLAPLADRPYIVFHDAYSYFETAYGLRPVAAVTVSPSQLPSAKRLEEIRLLIRESGAACVFIEPQFEPRFLAVILEDLEVRTGTLDPLGTALAPGPELYGGLMRALARSLTDCLAG